MSSYPIKCCWPIHFISHSNKFQMTWNNFSRSQFSNCQMYFNIIINLNHFSLAISFLTKFDYNEFLKQMQNRETEIN